ncbi:hypothetical protein CK203_107055 [Vitis vinifera]|uniref:Uncharacterized protein n=1 Tax=Vitis vinifera TaxID=29760 RepID=A0A438EJ46_VITVI|nr:hypothetical protein CK203_107055 [Vitis vinifera]
MEVINVFKKRSRSRNGHHESDQGSGGSDVTFVIQKPLFKTDVIPGHNRLSIPLNQIQQSFLTPEESERLKSGGNEKNVQIWK